MGYGFIEQGSDKTYNLIEAPILKEDPVYQTMLREKGEFSLSPKIKVSDNLHSLTNLLCWARLSTF